uniref:Exonuclease domain-containing protein n=1 Tax=viral metagenome TaxID=1070528 RepID=A0A6C0CQQ1_9ZZZZ
MTGFFEKLPETFIIFDTEFTAWEGSQERSWSSENEHRELVQISAFKIKKKGNNIAITKKLNIYILPRINRNLSDYFIQLTGITQETLEQKGVTFKKGMEIFYRFCKDRYEVKYPLYSMGNDYHVIKENLKLNSINKRSRFYKWEKKFHDITQFFSPYVQTNLYSSGTLYQAFKIVPNCKVDVHNASWDCLSLFLSLKKVISISHLSEI